MYCLGAQWPIDGSVRLELESRGRWFEPPKKYTAHKALCCVLEQDIVSSA